MVVLTEGILQDDAFAQVVLAMQEMAPLRVLTVLADTSFQFPGKDFFLRIATEGLGQPGLGEVEGEGLSEGYKTLLKILALPISRAGSVGLLKGQVEEICQRMARLKGSAEGYNFTGPDS